MYLRRLLAGARARPFSSLAVLLVIVAALCAATMTSTPSSRNPFSKVRLYINPQSGAAKAVEAAAKTMPSRAAALDRIAREPQAIWFGDWVATADIAARVGAVVNAAAASRAMPVLVVYAIPGRDCGSYSAGGLLNATTYRSWISAVAAGIGAGRVAVIVEPDALAQMGSLSVADQAARVRMVLFAVDTLSRNSGTAVYVDAGNAGWISADVMAGYLKAAGIAEARGFSLNVSSFYSTADEIAYGR